MLLLEYVNDFKQEFICTLMTTSDCWYCDYAVQHMLPNMRAVLFCHAGIGIAAAVVSAVLCVCTCVVHARLTWFAHYTLHMLLCSALLLVLICKQPKPCSTGRDPCSWHCRAALLAMLLYTDVLDTEDVLDICLPEHEREAARYLSINSAVAVLSAGHV